MNLFGFHRFEGMRWVAVPAVFVLVMTGLLQTVQFVRISMELQHSRARQVADALAAHLAPDFDRLSDEQLRDRIQPVLAGYGAIVGVAVRDAQGQYRLELQTAVAENDSSLWRFPIRLLAPAPAPVEAAIPGHVVAIASQPPAVRLRLRPPEQSPELPARLTRLWSLLLLCGLLAVPVVMLSLRRIVDRHRLLLSTARGLVQGRTELRAPKLKGISGEFAVALNQLAQQLTDSPRSETARPAQESQLLRQDLQRERQRLKALEQELDAMRETAQRRGLLIGSLGHELRTPLAALIGHGDLLLNGGGLSPAQTEAVQTLKSSAQQLMQLTGDLLDWGRIENGSLELARQRFDLSALIEDTVRQLAPLAYEKKLELIYLVYHDVPAVVLGDPTRLRQVLNNLLSNAIKFTAHGEVVLRVMKDRDEGDQCRLHFSVRDTGAGIAPEQQARLFLPYQRLQPNAAGGTGLGLVITRHLVERMSGQIRVESVLGQGSCFTAEMMLETVLPTAPAARPPLEGLHVWHVDAHATAQLALKHHLEWWNVKNRGFPSAEELEAALHGGDARPELLIIGANADDLVRPPMRRLLAGPLPVLTLLTSVKSHDHAQARALGARDSLPKCVLRDSLSATLAQLTQRAPTPATDAALRDRRVLIAENNLSARRYLKAQLESVRAQVIEAGDGVEALRLALTTPPDLLLLDVHMPGLDGYGVARELRAQAARRIPVIAMSAHLEPEEQSRLMLAGVDAIMLKPFDALQLQRIAAPLLGAVNALDTPTALLIEDPDLRDLLRQELPQQLHELENALNGSDRALARDAAHQLHGTCAFYKFPQLKNAAADIESRLVRNESPTAAEREALRHAAAQTLSALGT